jgi:LmbE family N-acetylglucosaminyl deacetylase
LTSPYTHRAKPPATEQVVENVTYRGSDVMRELERVVGDFQPTLVVFPDAIDEHPDHCSTSLFTTEAVRRTAEAHDTPPPRVLHYLVHYRQWPLGPYGAASARRLSPFDLPGVGRWRTLTLTAEESAGKRQALLSYTTQVRIMKPFLVGFARQNELYLEGEPTSSTPCWCQGEPVPVERARSRMARGSASARQ